MRDRQEVRYDFDPLLNAREAAPILGVSMPTFWRRVADGTISKPIKLGALSRWPRSEILAVIERAKVARDASNPKGGVK